MKGKDRRAGFVHTGIYREIYIHLGSSSVPAWFQLVPSGSSWFPLVPAWFQLGSSLAPSGSSWFQLASSLVPAWFQLGSSLVPMGSQTFGYHFNLDTISINSFIIYIYIFFFIW